MTLSLTILFIHLIANVRGPYRLAGIMPESPWPWLVVSLVMLSATVPGGPSLQAVTIVSFAETCRTMNEAQSSEALRIGNEVRRINPNISIHLA